MAMRNLASRSVLLLLLTACAGVDKSSAGFVARGGATEEVVATPTTSGTHGSQTEDPWPSVSQPDDNPAGSKERQSPLGTSVPPSCREVRRSVTVTYSIRVEPAPTGQRVWLDLTLINELEWPFYGSTGGTLDMTNPGRGREPTIQWGASSADGIGVRPSQTSTRGIYDHVGRKLTVPFDAKVASVGVYTFLTIPKNGQMYGPGRQCALPARMRAPCCFVLPTRQVPGS